MPDKFFRVFVNQANRQSIKRDDTVQQRGNVIQQMIQIKDGIDFVSDVNQRFHLICPGA